MALYLTSNKTKMVKLICSKGYNPTVRRARYKKAFRARSFWLTWLESDGLYEALLMTAGGKTYLRITNKIIGKEKMIHIPVEELQKYSMTEEINDGK